MNEKNQIIGFLALSGLKGIGPAFIKKATAAQSFSSGSVVEALRYLTALSNRVFDADSLADAVEDAKLIYRQCEENGISMIPYSSKRYPALLKELKDPPPVLYCKGNLSLLQSNIVGIIGTRQPNYNGLKISQRISSHFLRLGWTVCNGLADGIDTGAINQGQKVVGNVLGVLAGGLNFQATKTLGKSTAENAQLVLNSNGLLVSELKPGTKEDTYSVVKSCRIQSGLSKGLIVVQSSLAGGSKFAAKPFCETRRPFGIVYPVPADYALPEYEANREIIEKRMKGLSNFTGVKESKILTTQIFTIRERSNYEEFENLMLKTMVIGEQRNPTLFE